MLASALLILLLILLVVTVAVLVITLFLFSTIFSGAPWVATRAPIARAMCALADLKEGDCVLDLGCGDGTILITAAKEYGASGVGVELNPLLARWARWKARRAGVGDRVRIVRGNMFNAELPNADVAMLYLLPKATARVERRLQERYPHLRVVSHGFQLQDTPEQARRMLGEVTVRRYEW